MRTIYNIFLMMMKMALLYSRLLDDNKWYWYENKWYWYILFDDNKWYWYRLDYE